MRCVSPTIVGDGIAQSVQGERVIAMYGTSATDIVGYTFEADMICPEDLRAIAARYAESNGKAADHVSLPDLLAFWAEREGWDAGDESSYDSSDFPKVIFGSMVESSEDKCGWCGESLIPE